MGSARRKRHQADPVRRVCRTERDLWILESIGKMHFATTGQLTRLHFGDSRWSAHKGLRRLLDGGLVRVWVRDLVKENVYSLAPRGTRLLVDEGESRPGSVAVPRGLDGNLDHLIGINDVRIALVLSLGEGVGEIAWWRSDWDLRSMGKARVIPDALFAIRWKEEGEQAFALELENQSRSPKAFLGKVLGYSIALSQGSGVYGLLDLVLLVVCTEPEWVNRYRAVAAESKIDLPLWFAPLASLGEEGIEGAVWRAPEGEERYSLRDLATLPYGKEGRRA